MRCDAPETREHLIKLLSELFPTAYLMECSVAELVELVSEGFTAYSSSRLWAKQAARGGK